MPDELPAIEEVLWKIFDVVCIKSEVFDVLKKENIDEEASVFPFDEEVSTTKVFLPSLSEDGFRRIYDDE